MDWSGLGSPSGMWVVRFREIEHFVRRFLHGPRGEPEEELPDAELPEGERRAALRREAARRMLAERG